MSAIECVKTFITALQSGDLELAATTCTVAFTVSGLMPRLLDRSEFLTIQSQLLSAMPDFSYNLTDLHHESKVVNASIHMSGTHTQELSIPLFGIRSIAATGLSVLLPQVAVAYHVEGERVVSMRAETVQGGGFSGLLQQMGAELPLLPREKEIDL